MLALFFPLQDQTAKGERINKETGELSASGELSLSVELNVDKVEGSCKNPQLLQELREQLQELGFPTRSSPDHRTDHVPLEQRQEHLGKVLPLYIQVWTISFSILNEGKVFLLPNSKQIETISWGIINGSWQDHLSGSTALINIKPWKGSKDASRHCGFQNCSRPLEWTIKTTWGGSQMFGPQLIPPLSLNECACFLSENLYSSPSCHMKYSRASDPWHQASFWK